MAVFRFFKMAAVHHLEFVIRLLNTSTTEKTEIDKNRSVFVSRRVLNVFRISTTELSRIGRSKHAENCKLPVVIQFFATDQYQLASLGNFQHGLSVFIKNKTWCQLQDEGRR